VCPVLEKVDTLLDAGNRQEFRVFPDFHRPEAGDLACSRSSLRSWLNTAMSTG
jgi:hypothetical protein